MPNNPTYFELLKACDQPGCPVCRLEQQAVGRFLDHLFYESVNDGETRAHLRASLGFCREHTELLLETGLGDALGMAIIYQDVLGTVLKRLTKKKYPSSEGTVLARLLGRIPTELAYTLERVMQAVSPNEPCLACQQRESTERVVISVLTAQIQDPELVAAFARTDGLCLPHLKQAITQVKDEALLAELLKLELGKLKSLHAELAEYKRKSDYRYLKDGFGPEGNAWRRAAGLVSGGRSELNK